MENIYMLADAVIMGRIGARLKAGRLRQNITQEGLAREAGVSLSSLKKIEKGEIGSFDSLLRVLRTLGKLEVLLPIVEEEQLTPNEYYEMVNASGRRQRKRAAKVSSGAARKEEPEW